MGIAWGPAHSFKSISFCFEALSSAVLALSLEGQSGCCRARHFILVGQWEVSVHHHFIRMCVPRRQSLEGHSHCDALCLTPVPGTWFPFHSYLCNEWMNEWSPFFLVWYYLILKQSFWCTGNLQSILIQSTTETKGVVNAQLRDKHCHQPCNKDLIAPPSYHSWLC